MASGLAALLDDVAAIAKLAAASLDDVGAAAGKASTKAAGVVIDDTAVTPGYVAGLAPERELPIIWRIAVGSLRNKLLILLPVALLLSAFLPVAITPLLMLGGAFLCFEGAEKLVEALSGDHGGDADDMTGDPAQIEKARISGAIRTDLILSAEIMAISLGSVADAPLLSQALALIIVSFLVTAGVYGAVGLIVKMDDIGLHLARRGSGAVVSFGRALVSAMPRVMSILSNVGMAAMLWVGGGIIVHGLEEFRLDAVPHLVHGAAEEAAHAAPFASGPFASVVHWIVTAALSGLFGLAIGFVIVLALHRLLPLVTGKKAH